MPDLKNYEAYVKTIRLYAKAIGVKIVYEDQDGDGAYVPKYRKIRVDPDLSETRELSVLLHELGHMWDFALIDKTTERKVDFASKAVYKNKATTKQLRFLIQCERRAWNYGRAIAKKLGIPLGKWYERVQNDCLSSYRKA